LHNKAKAGRVPPRRRRGRFRPKHFRHADDDQGHKFAAARAKPEYIVKRCTSGNEAAHKSEALTRKR